MWETNRVSNGHGCCCFYSVSVPEEAVLQKAASALSVPLHLAPQVPEWWELHSFDLLEKQGGSSASLWIPPAGS